MRIFSDINIWLEDKDIEHFDINKLGHACIAEGVDLKVETGKTWRVYFRIDTHEVSPEFLALLKELK